MGGGDKKKTHVRASDENGDQDPLIQRVILGCSGPFDENGDQDPLMKRVTRRLGYSRSTRQHPMAAPGSTPAACRQHPAAPGK